MILTSLETLDIQEIVSSFAIVIAVIFALYETVSKLYKLFMTAHKAKTVDEDLSIAVARHGDDIEQIKVMICTLGDNIAKQEIQNQKVDCALLRDGIIQSYKFNKPDKDKGDVKSKINALDYENLNEMFIQYFNRNGNHLVSKIYKDFKTWDIELDDM
jgi:hypothetical protein